MTDRQLPRELVKAVALGDEDRIQEFQNQLSGEQREFYAMLATAMFAAALEVRFGDDTSMESVKRYCEEFTHDYRDLVEPIKSLEVEGLIRGMMGEERFFEEIDQDTQMRIGILSIRKIVAQSPQMQSNLKDYLADAEQLVDFWIEEDAKQ